MQTVPNTPSAQEKAFFDQWAIWAKAYPCKTLANGAIRTCPVRLSYPAIFEPKAPMKGDNGPPKYQAALLFPFGVDLGAVIQSAEMAGAEKFGKAWAADRNKAAGVKRTFYWPLKNQGEKADKDGYQAGAFYLSARTPDKPGVVDRQLQPVHDVKDVYAGCLVLATVRLYGSEAVANKGVFVGLNNLQFFAHGPKFSARSSANQDFEALTDVGSEGALEDMLA